MFRILSLENMLHAQAKVTTQNDGEYYEYSGKGSMLVL